MIPRERLIEEFERCRPWIEEALDRGPSGLYKIQDVFNFLLTGRCQLWSDTRACIVSFVDHKPRGNVFVLWLGAGELDAIIALGETARPFALEQGCAIVEINGRRGWAKALKAAGFIGERVALHMAI